MDAVDDPGGNDTLTWAPGPPDGLAWREYQNAAPPTTTTNVAKMTNSTMPRRRWPPRRGGSGA
jgi:hypothetical protein